MAGTSAQEHVLLVQVAPVDLQRGRLDPVHPEAERAVEPAGRLVGDGDGEVDLLELRVPCRNSARMSGGLPFVLVDQTAEPISALDLAARPRELAAGLRGPQPERLVWTRGVVVGDVLA